MTRPTDVRERVYHFYQENLEKGKSFTANHFIPRGIPSSTLYRILSRYHEGTEVKMKSRKSVATKMPKKQVKRLRKFFDHKTGRSQRKAASKFGISQSYVNKLLRSKKHGDIIKCRKKQAIPDRSELQIQNAKTKCRKLSEKYSNHDWVLDDESYFTLGHSSIVGNDIYYTSNYQATPASVKYSKKKKFQPKVMVWLAASVKGISKIFIVPSGMAINSDNYINHCLSARLIPFLTEHHSSTPYVFWPDLASSHYSKKTIAFVNEKKVNIVPKKENPANLPECRPIERFWYLLKAQVYKEGWKAKDLPELERKIRLCVRRFDKSRLVELFEGTKSKIIDVGRNGCIETR